MKKSKQNHSTKFFEKDLKNLINIYLLGEASKEKYNFYEKPFFKLSNITHYQNENIDNPERIANIFKNYFSTIDQKPRLNLFSLL